MKNIILFVGLFFLSSCTNQLVSLGLVSPTEEQQRENFIKSEYFVKEYYEPFNNIMNEKVDGDKTVKDIYEKIFLKEFNQYDIIYIKTPSRYYNYTINNKYASKLDKTLVFFKKNTINIIQNISGKGALVKFNNGDQLFLMETTKDYADDSYMEPTIAIVDGLFTYNTATGSSKTIYKFKNLAKNKKYNQEFINKMIDFNELKIKFDSDCPMCSNLLESVKEYEKYKNNGFYTTTLDEVLENSDNAYTMAKYFREKGFDITNGQYAALQYVADQSGVDSKTLAKSFSKFLDARTRGVAEVQAFDSGNTVKDFLNFFKSISLNVKDGVERTQILTNVFGQREGIALFELSQADIDGSLEVFLDGLKEANLTLYDYSKLLEQGKSLEFKKEQQKMN